jgi:DNA polymerase-3 subunit delta
MKSGLIRSLYVLEGDENYLKNKILIALESKLIEPSVKSLDYVVFDYRNMPGKVSLNKIENEIKTPPFMSAKRLVVVKNSGLFSYSAKSGKSAKSGRSKSNDVAIEADSDNNDSVNEESGGSDSGNIIINESVPDTKDKQSEIIKILNADMDTSCLVFIEDKIDKRMKMVIEKIKERGILAEITRPDIKTIRLWVTKELEKFSIRIQPAACDIFIERNDSGLQQMTGEIEKLVLHAKSQDKSIITETDVEEIGISDLKGSIFDLVDALSKNNGTEAYRILDVLIVQKQPIPLISFMLARHIRQLLTAKDIGSPELITKRMKVMPFVANKLYYQSKNFSFESLEDIYRECFDTDVAVKTSKIQDKLGLETLFAYTIDKFNNDKLIKRI